MDFSAAVVQFSGLVVFGLFWGHFSRRFGSFSGTSMRMSTGPQVACGIFYISVQFAMYGSK